MSLYSSATHSPLLMKRNASYSMSINCCSGGVFITILAPLEHTSHDFTLCETAAQNNPYDDYDDDYDH